MDRIADFGSVDGGSIPPEPIRIINIKKEILFKRLWLNIFRESQMKRVML